VKKGTPANMAASIHGRLLNRSKQSGRPFTELLQYYAMERFLYRLSKSSHSDRFVLKGALMFTALNLAPGRPTMDIDVEGRFANDPEFSAKMVKEICSQSVEDDGLIFDPDTVSGKRISEDAEYHGIRVTFLGHLGKSRIYMQIDIGFGDVVVPEIQEVNYPSLLDLPSPKLKMYSFESSIAEKFEAIVKLGMLNSRMKDFYDIWILSRSFEFNGKQLAEALKTTFTRRETKIQTQPVAFTQSFSTDKTKVVQWRAFVRKNRLKEIPDLDELVMEMSKFLNPVATAIRENRTFTLKWKSGIWGDH
jgi:predicted nucleotidyltransferase component of viral defense system